MDSGITWLGLTALGLAIVGCFSVPTLLGFWLSKSRLHWVLQALLIFAIASPLMLIRAFDLMLIVLVNAFLVLIGSKLWQRWQQRRFEPSNDVARKPWFQLGLQDGLAAVVLLAIVAAMWAQANKANAWTDDPGTAFIGVLQCSFIGAAAAIWGTSILVFRVLRLRFWLLWLALLGTSSVAAGWNPFGAAKFCQGWSLLSADDFGDLLFAPTITRTESVIGWLILLSLQALTVTIIVSLFRGQTKQEHNANLDRVLKVERNWSGLSRKAIGSGLLIVLLISIVHYFYCLLPPPAYSPIQQVVTGEPNSYPGLVAVGHAISPAGLGGWPPIKPGPTLNSKIKAQAKCFANIEMLLQAKNCFSTDWDATQFDLNSSMDDGSALRAISRALSTRALQSLSEGQHDDVVADGLRGLKLAERIAVDGTFILSLVGTACEGIGITATGSGIESASIVQLQKAASQLDQTVALFGPVDTEMERLTNADKHFMAKDESMHWLDLLTFGYLDNSSSRDSIRNSLIRRNVLRHLLRTEIAIRLYRYEFGNVPDNLESLVPDFLSEVPRDGYSRSKSQAFQYKVLENGQSYQLYSIGGDGDDDGGQTTFQYMNEGDLDLKIFCASRLADNAKEVAEYEAEQAEIAREQKEWEEFDELEEEYWEEGLLEEPSDER